MIRRPLAAIVISACIAACGPSTDEVTPAISGVVTSPELVTQQPATTTTLVATAVERSPEPAAILALFLWMLLYSPGFPLI